MASRFLNPEEEIFVSYGQSEPLTKRLNNILKDYTDGLTIIKELIQNADDAGATEIKFLYDERQNEEALGSLIDEGMKDLQGPALWSYNNAVFKEEDFVNLSKLCGATKKDRKDLIGQFGCGFNAVYNLTDVPSVVSQNCMIFLDPHATHLGSAIQDKSKPGIKLNFEDSTRLKRFPDQFKPYNGIFDCDLSGNTIPTTYPGTLFRFPLRTWSQAQDSEICKKHYSKEDVMELFSLLYNSGEHILLFTQHITQISVLRLPVNGNAKTDISQWFSIQKKLYHGKGTPTGFKSKYSKLVFQTNEILSNYQRQAKSDDKISERKQNKVDNNGPQLKQKETDKNVPDLKPKKAEKNIPKLQNSSILKITCHQSPTTEDCKMIYSRCPETSYWLVTECMGRGKSFTKALTESDLLPIAGVAARLNMSNNTLMAVTLKHTKSDQQQCGRLFCFLPLPCTTFLPIHVNGFFAVTTSRTHVYARDLIDKTDRRAKWNEKLMEDAVMRAYLLLLKNIVMLGPVSDEYLLWPRHSSLVDADLNLRRLLESLYEHICRESGPKLVRTDNGILVSLFSCRFLSTEFQSSNIRKVALSCCKTVSSNFIDLPEDIVNIIMQTDAKKHLQSKMVSISEFYEAWFLPNIDQIDSKERDVIIIYGLINENIRPMLRDINFIPVNSGKTLKKPTDLVDRNSSLAVLYDEDEHKFPYWTVELDDAKQFEINRNLIELGMKHNNLSWDDIINRCKNVELKPETAAKRTKVIVNLMSNKISKMGDITTVTNCRILNEIASIKFFPILKKPTGFPLKWASEENDFGLLTSCVESYLSTDMQFLVCCSFPIIDDKMSFDNVYQTLKHSLSLTEKSPNIKTVIFQLNQVLELMDESGYLKPLVVDEPDIDLSKKRQRYVTDICSAIYTYLNNCEINGILESDLIERLSKKRCIWLEKEAVFMYPACCAVDLPLGAECLLPYLGKTPRELYKVHQSLFQALQVQNGFEPCHFVKTLADIQQIFPNVSLPDRELEVVKFIINICLNTDSLNDARMPDIFVPDTDGILYLASSLICNYEICPWLAAENGHFCHNNIVSSVAIKIGVKTIREAEAFKDSIELGYDDEDNIAFGQTEALVNRLTRIMQGYPFDKEILNEMLQNADDAKATEVHFIHDKRQLPDESVFSNNWKQLQGPALSIFNNKPFTENDIKGIQRLGEGSKANDPTKTGQYGIGFNCVYHLTDVPSLLTQIVGGERVLCLFDPTCNFVPQATTLSPGIAMKNIEQKKLKFPDVFKGYFEKEYGTSGGSFLRLPLRNDETVKADTSTISKKIVSERDISNLFETFKANMHESMLFLKSVEKLQLKTTDDNGILQIVCSVETKLSIEDEERRKKFQDEVDDIACQLKNKTMELKDIKCIETQYELTTTDNNDMFITWFIIKRFGFEDPSCVRDKLNSAFKAGDINLLPMSGIAYPIKTNISAVCCPRLFCFLPLPLKIIGIPTHINAHFALDTETRMNLWHYDKGGPNTLWNQCLMTKVIAPAYGTFIEIMCDKIRNGEPIAIRAGIQNNSTANLLQQYHDLFPQLNLTNNDIKHNKYMLEFYRSIYAVIEKNSLNAVFPILMMHESHSEKCQYLWMNSDHTDSAYFDELSMSMLTFESSSLEKILCSQEYNHKICLSALVRCGLNILACPLQIFTNFDKYNFQLVCPETVVEFLRSSSIQQDRAQCHIERLPKPLSDTPWRDISTVCLILKYICSDNDNKSKLNGLPLLVTKDNHLRMFDEKNIVFDSKFEETLPHVPELFMHQDIFSALDLKSDNNFMLCKALSVENFANMISGVLTQDKYYGPQCLVNLKDFKIISTLKNPIKWLQEVWKFLEEMCTVSKSANTFDTTILTPIKNWCLLPVSCVDEVVLIPIGKAYCILNLNGNFYKDCLSELRKVEIPQTISYTLIQTTFPVFDKLYRKMVQNETEDPVSLVAALQQVLKCSNMQGMLDKRESLNVLTYLSKTIVNWKKMPGCISMLRKLPFYWTTCEQLVSIESGCVYVLPTNIPKQDMDFWNGSSRNTNSKNMLNSNVDVGCQKNRTIFIKCETVIKDLLEYLGCIPLGQTEVCCDFIFKQFLQMSSEGRLTHLTYIRDTLLPNLKEYTGEEKEDVNNKLKRENEYLALIESLHELRFVHSTKMMSQCKPPNIRKYPICTDENHYCKASEFFDPSNKLFTVMQKPFQFPTAPFCYDYAWLDFLKVCGMVADVSQEMFIHYAYSLASCATSIIDEKLQRRCETLMEHLFSREDILDRNFLQDIKHISFVLPHKCSEHNELLHRQYGQRNFQLELALISFNGSISHNSEIYVWTAQCALASSVDLFTRIQQTVDNLNDLYRKQNNQQKYTHPDNYTFKSVRSLLYFELGIDMEPRPEIVVQHLTNLCVHLSPNLSRCSDVAKVSSVCKKIYREINKFKPYLYAHLKTQSCLIIECYNMLVLPNQAVLNLSANDEIQPYLVKFPLELGEFAQLFQNIGTTQSANIEQFIMVLKMIQEAAGGSELLPSEREAACKATGRLLLLIKESKEKKLSALRDVHNIIYLPGKNGKMHKSSDVVINNDSILRKRVGDFDVTFLVDFQECGVDFTSRDFENILMKLPPRDQPTLLTNLVEVKMEENYDESISEFALSIENRVCRCYEFKLALKRLIYHACRETGRSEQIDKEIEEMLVELNTIKFVTVTQLCTYLNSVRTRQRIRNSERDCSYFIAHKSNASNTGSCWCVYVAQNFTNLETFKHLFYFKLLDVIDNVTKEKLSTVLPHVQVILACPIKDIAAILDEMSIAPLAEHSTRNETFVLRLGDEIPQSLHHFLLPAIDINNKSLLKSGDNGAYKIATEENDCQKYIYIEMVNRISNKFEIKRAVIGTTATVKKEQVYAFSRSPSKSAHVDKKQLNVHTHTVDASYRDVEFGWDITKPRPIKTNALEIFQQKCSEEHKSQVEEYLKNCKENNQDEEEDKKDDYIFETK